MAVAAALDAVQAEARCPVCLEGLRDSVTAECGRNSCRSCIQRSRAHLEDRLPCPVRRHPCQERQARSNAQLGRMIQAARLLQSSQSTRRRSEEPRLCELHRQLLGLCGEEHAEVLVCALCARTPEHQGHLVRPVGEAAAGHRQRLGAHVEPLERRVAGVHSLVAAQDRKLLQLRQLVQRQRLELASELRQLSRAVDGEQEAVLARLLQEEQDIQEQLGANVTAFSDHICELRGLPHEVTENVLPGARLLSGIGGVLGRGERLRRPDVCSLQLRREGCSLASPHSALQKIIQTFREDVTLDPETAHPNLLVSEDRKSVTFARSRQLFPPSAQRFCPEPAALGWWGFASCKQYWEGRVGGAAWAVGICADSAPRSVGRGRPRRLRPQERGPWASAQTPPPRSVGRGRLRRLRPPGAWAVGIRADSAPQERGPWASAQTPPPRSVGRGRLRRLRPPGAWAVGVGADSAPQERGPWASAQTPPSGAWAVGVRADSAPRSVGRGRPRRLRPPGAWVVGVGADSAPQVRGPWASAQTPPPRSVGRGRLRRLRPPGAWAVGIRADSAPRSVGRGRPRRLRPPGAWAVGVRADSAPRSVGRGHPRRLRPPGAWAVGVGADSASRSVGRGRLRRLRPQDRRGDPGETAASRLRGCAEGNVRPAGRGAPFRWS
ncbi:LOW QUALITY PROTEIN: tripartite motif-containing protein 75-like [Megaptera novaeangliae]